MNFGTISVVAQCVLECLEIIPMTISIIEKIKIKQRSTHAKLFILLFCAAFNASAS
jgi:hypothetical protein